MADKTYRDPDCLQYPAYYQTLVGIKNGENLRDAMHSHFQTWGDRPPPKTETERWLERFPIGSRSGSGSEKWRDMLLKMSGGNQND